MTEKKGFTLIELLVVIAIVSLLLSIVIPAVKMAKRKAGAAVCLTNVKNFSLAWNAYHGENNGRIMNSNPSNPDGWVLHPFRENGTACDGFAVTPPVTDEDEWRGIAAGVMYQQMGIEDYDAYRCPVDNRKSKYDLTPIFRSYAMPGCLGSQIRKISDIKQPSRRYNFVEEAEGRNFNVGTWDFYTSETNPVGAFPYWRDPISVAHGNGSVLGFCDGHAEVHQWVDRQTTYRLKFYFETAGIDHYGYGGNNCLNDRFPRDPSQVTDTEYMEQGWAYKKGSR
ncbi:MAG: prepilin-type N-terminal cleavage/methylation domain-containing protein [Anaerohalosphaeraceae bacterium]